MAERSLTWLLFIALTSWFRVTTASGDTCVLPSPDPGGQQRPTVSSQFTVHVEATFVDKNKTMHFVEYFDYDNNRGRLQQVSSGVTTDYYYDYTTNELFVVRLDTFQCQIEQLSTAKYTFLLGDSNGHIFSPAAALRFGAQAGTEVYVGKSSVRGIQVNQWTSCLQWPTFNTSMIVTWSFVDNLAWVASASIVNIPVLCHVTGNVTLADGSYRSFEHMYEFVHFYDNLPPASQRVFETPSGVLCPGRKNTRRLPTLPHSMQWTGETVNEQRKSITYTQEKYYARGRIVVFQFHGFSLYTTKYGKNDLTVITDFNTGTEYVLDNERGNCTMSPLNANTSPDVFTASDSVTLRMKSARDMLNLDANFTYQGQRTIRNTLCDMWIAQKSTVDMLGLRINATYEWAFSTANWTYLSSATGDHAVPVQVTYTLEDLGSRQQSVTNVYDYVGSGVDVMKGLNVDGCFIDSHRNVVTFSISRVYRTLLQYFRSQFQYAVRHSIADSINVSPLRVTNIQYRVEDLTLDVTLDLLPVSPVHGQVGSPIQQVSLEEATRALKQAVLGNMLVIQLFTSTGMPTYIMADPSSLRVTRLNQPSSSPPPPASSIHKDSPPSPPPPPNPHRPGPGSAGLTLHSSPSPSTDDKQTLCQQYYAAGDQGYSAGVMAGSAVGLGVVGAGLGLLTHRFLLRQGR